MRKNKCVPFFLFFLVILALLVLFLCLSIGNSKKYIGPVIGDLGGVPVAIPREYARFVTYDKDPNFMEKRTSSEPERNYESPLSGFGFDVRYPDMASVKVKTLEEVKHPDIHTTMWMRVLIYAGEHYGRAGDGTLEFRTARYLNPKKKCTKKCFNYIPLPNATYGLTGYTPTGSGVDVEGRSVDHGRGTDLRDKNIYYFKGKSGRISTFIECNNREHTATRCKQSFNLSPEMKVRVRVNYRKGLLPYWQQIQASITALMHSFETTPPSINGLSN